jgi:cellulose synthase/poly-beta-1,6-N-acetylglucosamine synthase-like glycosyltransferase
MLQEYYNSISALKKLLIKVGITYGFLLTTVYLILRAYYINFTPILAPFSVLLYLAELHTLILIYAMFYSLWPRNYKIYKRTNKNKNLQINMFVTVAGEPIEIVSETIKHAKAAAEYYANKFRPKKSPRVIVLNDGKGAKKDNWMQIRDLCSQIGVHHVARDSNEGYKAGNINNGLKRYPSGDPKNTIDCFIDSDFCVKEIFLEEILKPLLDENIDFVQSPQRYKNMDTWVAKAAGAHQIFFFDYICPAKAHDNALFLCGTNYAIRRQALLDAGGVENRFVTEDYATSIKLHLLGKRGVFISKVLALGLAPMNLKEYFNQQTRWCKGCLDANGVYIKELLFGPLNLRQKFHYFFSTAYYLIGVRSMILVLAPVTYLFFGVSLIRANTPIYLATIYLPFIAFNFTLFFLTFKNPVKSLVLDMVSFPVFASAFIKSVVKINLPFTITIKKYEIENPFKVYKIQLMVAALLMFGLLYSTIAKVAYNPFGKFINHFWAAYSSLFLMAGFAMVVKENYSIKFRVQLEYGRLMAKKVRNYAKKASVPAFAMFFTFSLGFAKPYYTDVIKPNPSEFREKSVAHAAESIDKRIKNEELLVPGYGAYYGYYLPELNYHPEDPVIKLSENDSPSLAMYYQDWGKNSGFNTKYMKRISDKGAVPIVTWEPWESEAEINNSINMYGNPQRLILSGAYDEHIKLWARGAKAYKKPFFLRFAHEMNGNWYPWGNHDEHSAELYRQMWIYVHNIFDDVGADNVIWVWSPNNTNQYGVTEGVTDYYPGDEYVDWTGFSGFNWGISHKNNVWKDFDVITFEIYSVLDKLGKPIMSAETSSVSYGGDKTGWFYKTLGTHVPQMPKIKAVVLFNQNFNRADFKLDSGMDSQIMIKENLIDNDYYLKEPILLYK